MFKKKYGMHDDNIMNLWMKKYINLIIHLILFLLPFTKHFKINNLQNIQN
jgi:hypothetical protein